MRNILIHGLGQDKESWAITKKHLVENEIYVECPNLIEINGKNQISYKNLFNSFSIYCNDQNEKLNLCGLSLGGILALDYVKKYPEKVNSVIIIGTPYKVSKLLFKVQGFIFHLMPKSAFEKIGYSKKDFINLVDSMSDLDVAKDLDEIKCKCLILCGIKDNKNMKSAKLLNESIDGSCFKTINNSSHEVNVDNPAELANIIKDFWGNE